MKCFAAFFSLFMLTASAGYAQSNKKNNPTVKESVGELKESFKAIGNIFKKKEKKDAEKQPVADTANVSAEKNAVPESVPDATAMDADSTFPVAIKNLIVANLVKDNSKEKPKLAKSEEAAYVNLEFDFGDGVRSSAYFSKLKKENVLGDLNNDGKEDAIIKVYSNSGGNSDYLDLYVFLQQEGGWKLALIKSSSDDDIKGCKIGQFVPEQISNGYLIGESSCFAASDPRCCPSIFYKTTLKFVNNRFTLIKKERVAKKN